MTGNDQASLPVTQYLSQNTANKMYNYTEKVNYKKPT